MVHPRRRRSKSQGFLNYQGLFCLCLGALLCTHSDVVTTLASLRARTTMQHRTETKLVQDDGQLLFNRNIHLESLVRPIDFDQYTVRINTWKRLEQLEVSIHHHASCPGVAQIQVVWCTTQGDPPSWLFHHPKVVVELHEINSLNERFNILNEPPTIGILSIDDDVLRPCLALDHAFFKWTQNSNRMVGFDARTHSIQSDGRWLYGHGEEYSLTLTRYAFLHRDYLRSYMQDMPATIRDMVSSNLNCEDIAMSFWVSSLTDSTPPLLADEWARKSQVKLYSPAAISGTKGHKDIRDRCVDDFANVLGLKEKLVSIERPHDTIPANNSETNVPKPQRQIEMEWLLQTWSRDGVLPKKVAWLKAKASLEAYREALIKQSEPWKKIFQSKLRTS